jgi:periplasmic protein TonB
VVQFAVSLSVTTQEDALFGNTLSSSWDERSRRGLTTFTSLGLQVLLVAALLAAPLLRPQGFPLFRKLTVPVSLGRMGDWAPQPTGHGGATPAQHTDHAIILQQPSHIPINVAPEDDVSSPPFGGSGPSIGPAVGEPGGHDGIFNPVGTGVYPVMPAAPVVEHPVHISHMSEGDLVKKVLPSYPPLARSARIQGAVILQAMISKQGAIENLRLLTGHPMLAPAAIEAVRQWRYRPYILNGEPVEVDTQITVNFSLAGN